MNELLAAFPDPGVAPIVKRGRKQVYATPDGDFPRVTSILEALAKPFLVPWAAKQERTAVLEAVSRVLEQEGRWLDRAIEDLTDGKPRAEIVAYMVQAVEDELGPAKAHQKQVQEAADIGTAIHQEIQRRTHAMLKLPHAAEAPLRDEVTWAVMAWEDWIKSSGIRPFRCEQPVWSVRLGVAGTVDLLAFDSASRLGIVDYKSSKGIYDSHHVQVATYCEMASEFAPIEWAKIVRVPKNVEDPAFEVKDLGELYDRTLTHQELVNVFRAASLIHRSLMAAA